MLLPTQWDPGSDSDCTGLRTHNVHRISIINNNYHSRGQQPAVEEE